MENNKISSLIDIHMLPTVILKVCWTLDFLKSSEKDRFSIKDIKNFLIEEKEIPVSRQAIEYALKANKNYTHKNKLGYKIMKPGQDEVKKHSSNNKILLIEPGKPFTNKLESSKNIFQKLKGDIKICDPYCSAGILDLIYKSFNKGQNIYILTSNIIDKPAGSFKRALSDLITEGYQIEVRNYNSSVLHDRYILSKNNSWLSGYGFNDIGKKESFLVYLGDDISHILDSNFNGRWKQSLVYKPAT